MKIIFVFWVKVTKNALFFLQTVVEKHWMIIWKSEMQKSLKKQTKMHYSSVERIAESQFEALKTC